MRKSEWISEGSVVVISLREIGMRVLGSQGEEGVGDILALVDRGLYGKLKKQPGVNSAIFTFLETQDLNEVKRKVADGTIDEDDIFDRGSEEEEDDDDSDSDGLTSEERKAARLASREKRAKAKDVKLKSERSSKMFGGGDEKGPSRDDDIDIDAI
jgi:hypothetical protein